MHYSIGPFVVEILEEDRGLHIMLYCCSYPRGSITFPLVMINLFSFSSILLVILIEILLRLLNITFHSLSALKNLFVLRCKADNQCPITSFNPLSSILTFLVGSDIKCRL